jgi:hypothetical protein
MFDANIQKEIILWSWQCKNDFRFLDQTLINSIAPLVATFFINKKGYHVEAQKNAIILPKKKLKIIAVFRFEITSIPDVCHIQSIVKTIVSLTKPDQEIQIDFDAKVSQRVFYKAFLDELYKERKNLSITALASWCFKRKSNEWIESLPIRYAVPMLYNLGALKNIIIRNFLTEKKIDKCKEYVGLHMTNIIDTNQKIFLFSDHLWKAEDFKSIFKNIN